MTGRFDVYVLMNRLTDVEKSAMLITQVRTTNAESSIVVYLYLNVYIGVILSVDICIRAY